MGLFALRVNLKFETRKATFMVSRAEPSFHCAAVADLPISPFAMRRTKVTSIIQPKPLTFPQKKFKNAVD